MSTITFIEWKGAKQQSYVFRPARHKKYPSPSNTAPVDRLIPNIRVLFVVVPALVTCSSVIDSDCRDA